MSTEGESRQRRSGDMLLQKNLILKQNRENPDEIGMVGQSVLSTEMPTPGDLKPGDSLIFTNPTHPPPNKLTQPPVGMQHSYKKLQPFFKDFSRTTLDFQGQLIRNIISQIVQKCTFPVHSNKTLRL